MPNSMIGYRYIRITDYYPQYLKKYYQSNAAIASKTYDEQYHLLTNDSFEIVSSFSKNLNKINGVEAIDIISNASILQDTWRKEHQLPEGISKQDLVLAQLKHFKPDVIWIDDFSLIDATWKQRLIKEVPSIKLVLGHICAPYNDEMANKFRLFDVMFTCIPCMVHELKAKGINTHLLYHSFETTILDKLKEGNKFPTSEFLFSGSLYPGSGFHKSRIEYIEGMLKAGIDIDLYCNLDSFKKVFVKKTIYHLINGLKAIGLESLIDKISFLKQNKSYGDVPIKFYSKKLLESTKEPVFGFEMYQLLSKAKITFNIHGEVAEKCAGNIRLFEATGVGTCLVTDWKDNITDLFEPGKEVITYKTIEECIEKVKWLIENPEERDKIAKAGQQKTLTMHSVEARAKMLNEIINKELSKK